MVVSHLLKKPIVTRYIRIIPVSWQSAIALRTDFYGCKSGEYLFRIFRYREIHRYLPLDKSYQLSLSFNIFENFFTSHLSSVKLLVR